MKKALVIGLILAVSSIMVASISSFTWGSVGLQAEAAQVDAAAASLRGLMKANPFGAQDNPGLTMVFEQKTDDLIYAMETMTTALDEVMPNLTFEEQQAALDAYVALAVNLVDIKAMADIRLMTVISADLGDSIHLCSISSFTWGNMFNLDTTQVGRLTR